MVLRIEGVAKRYPGFRLGPVDLAVDDVTAVLGPSGCGKTTLLGAVAGLVEPDAGSVRLGGRRLDGLPPEERGTAMVFQEGALFPHMTARENVAYAADSAERVGELAASLEFEGVLDRPASALSGGQAGRVALARALATDPDALLLDEPLANLDAPIRRRLRGELRDHLAGLDVPVVYVTHDQRGAAAVGDRVAVMADGRLHQVGEARSVFERPATPFVAAFTGACVSTATVVDGGLRWQGHRLTADVDGDPGAEVEWCIRPERVEVGDPAGLEARVAAVVYEGDATVAELSVGDGRIEARLPPDAGIAEGETVGVGLPPDAIRVFNR